MSNMDTLGTAAIDFHCHGIGNYDFSDISNLNLEDIESQLVKRNQKSVLTLYLPKPGYKQFLELMNKFDTGRKTGKYTHIVGLALEGPLLSSHGGTPSTGVWSPTEDEWTELAKCGKKGLIYVVISPDISVEGSNFYGQNIDVLKTCEILLKYGVLPSPGHFVQTNPKMSANLLQQVYDLVKKHQIYPTVTDHLYNDMPKNFKHTWRTVEEKRQRSTQLEALNIESWNLNNLEEKLGDVPAVMIRNAKDGVVKLCINFDGEHVDFDIIKKTIEIVGKENLLFMTDSIESKRLAGRDLYTKQNSGLLYQDKGIVAAGSQNIEQQLLNMQNIGMTQDEIIAITQKNPSDVLHLLDQVHSAS